jgi:hypothetical protein
MAVDIRTLVARSVRKNGAAQVARTLGVSREAVLAYAGDFPRQLGTDAVIEQRAGRLSGAEPPPEAA